MDIIENINNSVIQHGHHNDRIYLMQLNTDHVHNVIKKLDCLALRHGYGKIFAKIPATVWNPFKSAGYVKEAVIPGFFAGTSDGFFVAKYFSEKRKKAQVFKSIRQIFKQKENITDTGRHQNIIKSPTPSVCRASDVPEMAAVYQTVFKSYPFPIDRHRFLTSLIKKGVLFFCVRIDGKITALASADRDPVSKSVEMTDFATLPGSRKLGFASKLLRFMDKKMHQLDVKNLYSIVRASSYNMNSIFNKNNYHFAGILKNNTQICGNIQSMVVWYRHL
jgi:putative beta-lysine N-acetyltransferase